MTINDRNRAALFSLAEKAKLLRTVQRIDRMPRAMRPGGASTYRPPAYSVAEFKLQEDLHPGSGAGAKFWYDGTEGDEVDILAFGLNGIVEAGEIVVCYWWDGRWKFLASEECPADDDAEEEGEEGGG